MGFRLQGDIIEELRLLGVEVVFPPVAAERHPLGLVGIVASLVIIDDFEFLVIDQIVGVQF